MKATYEEFDQLCDRVRYCTKCPRMDGSLRVLNRAAGPIDAPIMFIGEAPGRLGADTLGIPFHGDRAGHNFEELLKQAGIDRALVFVTNAALCNPKDDKGNNATPNRQEARNCSGHLRAQIDLIQPRVIVTLGAVALEALKNIEDHGLELQRDVRTANKWYGRLLVPLYHPGQRAMIHRSMANQRSDYQFVGERLGRLDQKVKKVLGAPKIEIRSLARLVLEGASPLSYFALHKLFYLVEYEAAKTLGRTFTSAFFIRQKDGPYCTDLHLEKLKKAIPGLKVHGSREKLMLVAPPRELFGISAEDRGHLPADAAGIVKAVVSRYGKLSDAELKTKTYLTAPMRSLLRAEQTDLVNLYNAPIDLRSGVARSS